jgi:hypothetical protein
VQTKRISRKQFVQLVTFSAAGAMVPSCGTSDDDSSAGGASGSGSGGYPNGGAPGSGGRGGDGDTTGHAESGAGASGAPPGAGGVSGDAAMAGRSTAGASGQSAGGAGSGGSTGAGRGGSAANSGGAGGSGTGGSIGTGGTAGGSVTRFACQITMTNQHENPHTLTIPDADLAMPMDRVYALATPMTGPNGHAHDVRLSSDELAMLAAGGTVEVYSQNMMGHYHVITIKSCPRSN